MKLSNAIDIVESMYEQFFKGYSLAQRSELQTVAWLKIIYYQESSQLTM